MARLTISEQEYNKLRKLGMTKEEIVTKFQRKESPLVRGAEAVTNVLGLRGAVETLGTNLAQVAAPFTQGGALAKGQSQTDRILAAQKNIGQTSLRQNIGAGFQIGAITAPGSTAKLPLTAALKGGAALGAASLGGQAATEDRSASRIIRQAAIGGVLSAGITAAARGVEAAGKGVFKYFIPRNKQEAQMLQTYKANKPFLQRLTDIAKGTAKVPRTAAETAFEQPTIGTEAMIGVQAKRAQTELWKNLIKPQLDSITDPVDLKAFFDTAKNEIIAKTPELTRQRSLLNALESVADDYADEATVSLSKLQDLKSGWAEFVPEKVYRGESISGALNEVRNFLASQARQTIYDKLGGGIRTAYIDYGNLGALKELGQKAMAGSVLKPGGTQSLIESIFRKLLTPISTISGFTVYKAGKGIELIGPRGLSTVGQFILNLTSEADQQQAPQATPQEAPELSSQINETTETPSVQSRVGDDGTIYVTDPRTGHEIGIGLPGVGGTAQVGKALLTKVPQLAQKLNIGQYKALKEYISSFTSGKQIPFQVFSKISEVLDELNVEKLAGKMKPFADDFERTDFLQKLVNAYEDLLK